MAEPYYSYTVRVKASLNEKLQATAKKYEMSLSGFITYCVEDVLNHGDNKKLKDKK